MVLWEKEGLSLSNRLWYPAHPRKEPRVLWPLIRALPQGNENA